MRIPTCQSDQDQPRAGSALLSVLVIVAMLSLAAYTYSELMLTEYEASIRASRMIESRLLVDSGVEWAASIIGLRGSDEEENLYHNPEQFHQIEVMPATTERAAGYFSIVSPVEAGSEGATMRFGLRNESAKININAIAASGIDEIDAQNFLIGLPNMTPEIADAILDFIDNNDDPRTYGAESAAYSTYECKNAPLDSLDELLGVSGVTPELLYGEDRNRNGLLDKNEDDGAETEPFDNQDGVLEPGWIDYLTVHSRESNLRSDGSEKIPINSNVLTDVYDQILEEYDESVADFVVAYRLFGPSNRDDPDTPDGLRATGSTSELTSEEQEVLDAISKGISEAMSGGGGSVTRGGMDLSNGGNYEIKSLFDLVDAQVDATIEGNTRLLVSPWSSNPGDLLTYFPQIDDTFGLTTDTWIEGRIDINQARYETLFGIPGMTSETADGILSSGQISSSGEPIEDALENHQTVAWLLAEGVVDLASMRQLDPYITTKGDFFQAQIVGYFGKSGISSRINVLIDGSQNPPRVISISDYSELGAGYPLHQWQEE